tara:strand:- start:10759 stop:12078 length:1320 start_codon:yes stop_codon:yes gene_type:complete
MAVAAKPEISKILLDLGIEPVDVYAVENAEQTYIAALVEGINTLEVANKGESTRSKILRDELKGVREKKRIKVSASKLFAQKKIISASKIRPQALLPAADDSPSEGKGVGNILNGILNILRLGNKQDKKESIENRKERQRQKREKRENAIESLKGGVKKAASAGKKAVSALVSPFSSILDGLINFLKVTLLGTLINGALNWFSNEDNQRKITNLGRFFKDWWPSLLGGFLLFFTPIGTLVSKVAGLLVWAIPKLAGLIASNPILAAATVAVLGAKALDGDFGPPKELTEEEKIQNKEKVDKVMNMGVSSLNEGGIVPSPSIVRGYNEGGMVSGSGNTDTVPAMLTPGELVIPKNDLKPRPMSGRAPSMIPVKSTATARTPVGTPVKVKSVSTTTVLPTIKKPKRSQRIREGSTIPVFRVASKSNAREITIRSLGIEEAL